MKCFLCGTVNFTIDALVVHLRIFHSLQANSNYECAEVNCAQAFTNVHTFKRHIKKHISSNHNSIENNAVYFCKNPGEAPKGKIYSNYFNQFRLLKRSGLAVKRRRAGNEVEINCEIDIDENIQEHLNFIKEDNCTWAEIEQHYSAVTKYRISKIAKASKTSEILAEWKHYRNPQGYKLIHQDFKHLYPCAESFMDKFEVISEKLKIIFKDKVKEQTNLELFKNLQVKETVSENGKNTTMLYLLHSVLVPTSKTMTIENGKKVFKKHSIKDSQNEFLIVGKTVAEAEEQMLNKFKKKRSRSTSDIAHRIAIGARKYCGIF